MITRTTIAATLIALTTLASVPAQASDLIVELGFDGYGYGWSADHGWRGDRGYGHHHRMWRERLSADEVRWMLNDAGYHEIRFFDDRGPIYQLRARRHGDVFFLIVSARTGEILSRNRI